MSRLTSWLPLWRTTSISVGLHIVAVLVLLLVGAAAWYEIGASRNAVIAGTERQMSRLDMVFAEHTGRAVEAVDLLVSGALETVQLRLLQGAPMEGVADTLRRRMMGVRQLAALTVVNAAGDVLVSTEPDRMLAPPALVAALLARARENPKIVPLISPPFRTVDARWYALLARPMTEPDGRLSGMAVGVIALSYFEDFYRAVDLNEDGAINLHLRDGTVLARYPHVDSVIGTSYGDLPPFRDILTKSTAGTLRMDSPLDGNRRILAIRALRAFPLAVMVSVEQERVLLDWRHGTVALVGIAVPLGGAVVFLLLTLARRLVLVEDLLEKTQAAQRQAERANERLVQQIAERERAETELRQAQRMEAIGQLTGGLAHDFNNLLTVVLGNVDILQRRTPTGDATVASRLDAIRSAARKGATLTGHLLSFARRQPLMPRPVDLNATVLGMQDLLDSALGTRTQVALRLAPGLWPAMVDQGQMELVILNLAINARDAMPGGGVVTIETMNHWRPDPDSADEPPAGDYVRIVVSDTGTGMPPEVLARVFEPFFTTKPPGAGSGLGLSQVFGTARQSGGEVNIESEAGLGTTVTVDLPRAASAAVEPARPVPASLLRGSDAAILLVDDDGRVRAVTAGMLNDLGYRVREADGGRTALALLEQEAPPDILLTDLVMPEIAGNQLAKAALDLHPEITVIYVTGYAEPLRDLVPENHRLIRKPFTSVELHTVIEAALAGRRSA